MTFRLTGIVMCVAFCAACGSAGSGKAEAGSGIKAESAAGTVASAGDTTRGKLPSNHMGRIPVLEYHVIGGNKNSLYTRTVASYKADLEDVYRRGYRPITIAQMLDKNFSEVPAGMSPVVFVFDDASPEQFRYIEQNGKLTIDPTSGVGIWLDFAKTHPGWKNRATFCMLNGGASGHNFFGDGDKFQGQKKEWRLQKVKWLADQGFELCDHTLWHAKLNKYPDAVVQEQIARNMMGIDSAVPGYKIRTMALPYGLWPKNRQLAWQGTWTDPKTKQAHPYRFDAVLEVSGGPARSPFDPAFDPHSITRIEAIGNDISKTLDQLDKTKSRFVK
jgi:Polysaccharide deacetylase.